MFKLMKLPYEQNALEPTFDSETISYHYNKHHQGYIDNLNKLVEQTAYEDMDLEEVIRETSKTGGPLFDNAAQVYNHNLYWGSLSPKSKLSASVEDRISRYYGSLNGFKTTVKQTATKHFGSGWVWICQHEDESLFVQDTHDAGTPIIDPLVTPLLVIDLWEHAYYLQWKNDRAAYIDAIWSVINWDKLQKPA